MTSTASDRARTCFTVPSARQVFLGAARDYTVVLDDKTSFRVTAPPTQDIAPGQDVWLRLPGRTMPGFDRREDQ
jgi:hypothetical protein